MGPVYSIRSGRDDLRGCRAGSGGSLAAWAGGIYLDCAGAECRLLAQLRRSRNRNERRLSAPKLPFIFHLASLFPILTPGPNCRERRRPRWPVCGLAMRGGLSGGSLQFRTPVRAVAIAGAMASMVCPFR